MWQIAAYLGNSGSYLAARDLFQLIADAYNEDDAYGAEHPDTLAARANLALWTGMAGDAAGARDQFAALLRIYERVSGAEHPDTLPTGHELARWTGEAGDAAGARDQFAALLPISERVLGAMRRARRYQAWHRGQCLLIDAIRPFPTFSGAFCLALAGLASRAGAGAG